MISDTHLREVTPEFREIVEAHFSDCDYLLHAGDFVSAAVYHYLKDFMKGRFKGVRGNMDFGDLARVLPEKLVLEFEGVRIGLTHGWGAPYDLEDRLERFFEGDDVQCIVYGHSHQGANHRRRGILFFNPGSPTDTIYAQVNTVGYLTIEGESLTGQLVEVK